MFFKLTITTSAAADTDVTDDLTNWDEVEVAFARSDLDGVTRSFSTAFEFAGTARALLLAEYMANYMQSTAAVVYYTRNASWGWDERFRCSLDFSTLDYTDETLSINAVDDSLAALIKANKNTTYEYPVSGIANSKPLTYDRILFRNIGTWSGSASGGVAVMSNTLENVYYGYVEFPLWVEQQDLSQTDAVTMQDAKPATATEAMLQSLAEAGGFLTASEATQVNVDIAIDFYEIYCQTLAEYQQGSDDTPHVVSAADGGIRTTAVSPSENTTVIYIYLFTVTSDSESHILKSQTIEITDGQYPYPLPDYEDLVPGEAFTYSGTVSLAEGARLALAVRIPYGTSDGYTYYYCATRFTYAVTKCRIYFENRADTISVGIVKPVTVLERLLASITGRDDLTAEIDESGDERLANTYIVAAESIRGISGAKLYTSYTKFTEWMSAVFGYVPVVSDDGVTFRHRSALFTDTEVKSLGTGVTDVEYQADSSRIYSSVKTGYDSQDYDTLNGRDEFNFTHEYMTGVQLTSNTLELISPYRADSYGFEVAAQKRGEDTTDSDADKDVFFILAAANGSTLVPDRSVAIDGILNYDTVFNAAFNPRTFLSANAGLIAACTKSLQFASSDGNADATFDGVATSDDVELTDRLFTVGTLQATTGDVDAPDDLTGYVTLESGGIRYEGFITSASFRYAKQKEVTYKMVVRKAEASS